MAIDDAEKRRSAANIGYWLTGPGVTPESALDAQWRAQSANTYSGFSLGASPPAASGGSLVFTGGVFH